MCKSGCAMILIVLVVKPTIYRPPAVAIPGAGGIRTDCIVVMKTVECGFSTLVMVNQQGDMSFPTR